jgi:hypothetical protein
MGSAFPHREAHVTRWGAATRTQIVLHVATSLFGSYLFIWGFCSLGVVFGVAAGMPFADAQTLLFQLAFVVFLTSFCWTFAARSLARVWVVLCGGGAAMTAAAWLLARAMV